ncbi:H(+)/Cl(-) exchange transporter 7 [Folsomia candida]|uniref:Chloride channel protein n=1 Tax=Folsomia candida TaxID=158441 RepID=A0A226E2X4_FOLCA|nr:H(+)/Cl(-) exchange transporter 7 [Folsomia candida]
MSGEVFGRANDERTPLLRPRQEDRGNDDASNPFNYNATSSAEMAINSTDEDDRVLSQSMDEDNILGLLRRRRSYESQEGGVVSSSSLPGDLPHRPTNEPKTVRTGNLNLLSSKFESLDYDICENSLLIDEERTKGYQFIAKKDLLRWVIMIFIGIFTALIACCIDIAIEEGSGVKFNFLKKQVDQCVEDGCLSIPFLYWILCNLVPVLIGSLLVVYVEPVAAGSGIPQVKCYLNGVKVPRIVRVKTLIVKAIGVTCSVLGGLAVGKEGPMIHSGAVVAAGLSQGKSTTLRKDFKLFTYFREDHEKRDFVSGGAAAGVAAAFGAPVGGVLFSLEEGASFWNQSLTWRIFFCSLISTFTLNVVLSTYHGRPGELTYSGLLNFGKFDNTSYDFIEIPLFILMGILGGLLGALFNHLNFKLTVFRIRNITKRYVKVLEAVLVSAVTATVGMGMILYTNDCKPLGDDPTKYPVQMYCGDGQYSAIGAIWFQTPEGSHKLTSILMFFAFYFFLSCWTYGLSVSSGLFIPSLLTGAAWGRVVGMGMEYMFPDKSWVNPGKYALIGAAAQLGGVVRMTISLTVILIEATGNLTLGLPLMITLLMAKWVGDYFNEGIYDTHIRLMGVPILEWEPPPLSRNIHATEVMSTPVISFSSVENVGRIIDILTNERYNGFPVVDTPMYNDGRTFGKIRGLILRSQLIVMLQHKLYNETAESWSHKGYTLKLFRDAYPRYPTIQQVHVSDEERHFTVDLRPIMNPSPYSVMHSSTLPRIFKLFRGLGLRHVIVVNDNNEVVGIVTRKDLARYRMEKHMGNMRLSELTILD